MLIWSVLTPFLGALIVLWLGKWLKAKSGYVLALCFIPALSLLAGAPQAKNGQPVEQSISWIQSLGLEFSLKADGFSLVFVSIVAGIGVLVFLYAAAYLGAKERHGRFYSALLIFAGAMLGLVLSDNLIALLIFWELTSVSSFLLIGFWHTRLASQDGAIKALVITAAGGLALLLGVILLIQASGSYRLSELSAKQLQESPLFIPAMIMILLAAFTKSAQIPFHLWLPTAMEAPTPVSAYLHSATMVKAGVILIAKMGFLFQGTPFETVVMYVGLLTLFWGSYLALRQNDLKALLAYSTISQLGLLMSLYGAGHTFAATAHLINHAVFKAVLFMVVGIIDHETKSRSIDHLSGLRHKLPITMALAIPATLSMAGLPIFGGFISKELFYEEMLHQGTLPITLAVVGSIMTFAYSLRFLKVFWGPLRTEHENIHEAKFLFWLPLVPLSLLVVLFGIWPLEGFGLKSPTLATFFTNLAAPSFGYTAKDLYLWHGLNTALILSIITWILGWGLHLLNSSFTLLQRRLTPSWNTNTLYYQAQRGLESISKAFISFTQEATFASHLRVIFLAVVAIGIYSGWRYLPETLNPIPLTFMLIAFAIIASVAGVITATSRLSSIIYASLSGVATTLIFVLLSAPDLALTQLLIETVVVILFLSVFRFLPRLKRYHRAAVFRISDALIATGVAATMFTLLIAVQQPVTQRIQEYFIENSKKLGGGYNVVNVILVDFRGYDTMGEIVVLAVVAVTVYALLKLKIPKTKERETDPDETP